MPACGLARGSETRHRERCRVGGCRACRIGALGPGFGPPRAKVVATNAVNTAISCLNVTIMVQRGAETDVEQLSLHVILQELY